MADYFYVHKKILPNYLEKVLEAREMLDSREAATVTEATERIGISRNTYYRYKDYVFRAKDPARGQQAVLSLLLADLPGALSSVLTCVTDHRASVLTISQAIPLASHASVLMSLDLAGLEGDINTLLADLKSLPFVKNLQLAGLE